MADPAYEHTVKAPEASVRWLPPTALTTALTAHAPLTLAEFFSYPYTVSGRNKVVAQRD